MEHNRPINHTLKWDTLSDSFRFLTVGEQDRRRQQLNPSCVISFEEEEMKRERSTDQDDDPEIMPLSKRMNNIHFEGSRGGGVGVVNGHGHSSHPHMNGLTPEFNNGFHHHHQLPVVPPQDHGNTNNNDLPSTSRTPFLTNGNDGGDYHGQAPQQGPLIAQNPHSQMTSSSHPLSHSQTNGIIAAPNYCPGLSREENPIYFEQNRLLFELYKERLERQGQPKRF